MLNRMQQKRASNKANQEMESAMAGLEMSSEGGDGLGEGEGEAQERPKSASRWKDAARRARGDTGYGWRGVQCGLVVWVGGVWRHWEGWEWGCIARLGWGASFMFRYSPTSYAPPYSTPTKY
jgi:hypothetical protein